MQLSTLYQSPNSQLPVDEKAVVSVGTYNLKGLSDPDGLARTLRQLDFVDIWAFQEVNLIQTSPTLGLVVQQEARPPAQLLRILPSGKWNIYYVPMNRVDDPLGTTWEGQAIASRYPLINKQVWPLRASGRKKRAALACEAHIVNTNVFLINTDHEVGMISIGPDDRKKQVEDLITMIEQNARAQTNPLVLLGDFNTVGDPLLPWGKNSREEIQFLHNAFRRIGIHPLPGVIDSCPTFHFWGISRSLDHIFLRNMDCCQWGTIENDQGSDHRPLWIKITRKR